MDRIGSIGDSVSQSYINFRNNFYVSERSKSNSEINTQVMGINPNDVDSGSDRESFPLRQLQMKSIDHFSGYKPEQTATSETDSVNNMGSRNSDNILSSAYKLFAILGGSLGFGASSLLGSSFDGQPQTDSSKLFGSNLFEKYSGGLVDGASSLLGNSSGSQLQLCNSFSSGTELFQRFSGGLVEGANSLLGN